MDVFDSKIFNAQVFGAYVDTVPRTVLNMLQKSGVLRTDSALAARMPDQAGGWYGTTPIKGRIGKSYVNYDGKTNITRTGLDTYEQSVVAIGRAAGFEELDFTMSITGNDFMKDIAAQVSDWKEAQIEQTLLSTLKGMFSMTGANNLKFVDSHTFTETEKFTETTLNSAMQKAAGDNKSAFSLAMMHSAVATNLENLRLIAHLKYTDESGIQRDLELGTLNGRMVVIDDGMPFDGTNYTTYVLGRGAIIHTPLPVKTPYSMARDEARNGGVDELYVRMRDVFAPSWISFTKQAVASTSPIHTELEMGVNWEVVSNSDKTATVDLKAIPISRIISKG